MKKKIILFCLFILLFVVNYSFLDSLLISFFDEREVVIVKRVVDGDTIVIEGELVRLLGVNSPERGEDYFLEAKEFLEKEVLNKSVRIEFGKKRFDKYGRELVYVFFNGENINLKLVREGFANFYFPDGKDIYYDSFREAWQECEENLCEKSTNKCASCIKLREFDYENEIVVFENICGFDCDLSDWEIKDEGRKSFLFSDFILEKEKSVRVIVSRQATESHTSSAEASSNERKKANNKEEIFWVRNDYVWTDSGDSLFLRDGKGKLVLWESY